MRKSPAYVLCFLFLPTFLVGLAALLLMTWHIPSHVRVELTANRVVFTIAGNESTRLLTPIGVGFVTIQRFARLEFRPETIEVANPAKYLLEQDRYPESAWTALVTSPPVVITGKSEELQPAVTMETETSVLSTAGTLDAVWARPGARVTLETNESHFPNLTVEVGEQQSSTTLSMKGRFLLIVNQGQLSGTALIPYKADSLTFRVRLPTYAPAVEINGLPRSLLLVVAGSKDTNLFSKEAIPIKSIEFTRQEGMGRPQTSLVGDGTITYPDYGQIKAVSFKAPDFVALDMLDKFHITEMTLDPKTKGIRMSLHGVAGRIKTGSPEFPVDQRLTALDTVWQNQKLIVLASIIAWVFSTTVAAHKLRREISKR